jgi:hypothetical protein
MFSVPEAPFLRDAPDGDLFAGSERYAASRVYRGLQ